MASLTDLNDHLFNQLDRLKDNNLKGDNLKEEIERAKAVSGIAKNIAENARLTIDAAELQVQHPTLRNSMTGILEDKRK